MKIGKWIKRRLKEPSTRAGLAAVVVAAAPQLAIPVKIALAVAGGGLVAHPEKRSDDAEPGRE